MTRIDYDREELRMDFEGHALYGKPGQDIVCAALSILAMTLIKRLEDMEQLQTMVSKGRGKLSISCQAGEEDREACREIFDTVYTGCALLGENYPGNVKLMERGR